MSFHVHLYVVICHQHITKYTQMFGFGPTYARGIAMLNHSAPLEVVWVECVREL